MKTCTVIYDVLRKMPSMHTGLGLTRHLYNNKGNSAGANCMHSHPMAAAVLSRVTQRKSDYKALSSPVESLTILQRTQKAALLSGAAQTPRGEQEKVGRLLFLQLTVVRQGIQGRKEASQVEDET